MIETIKAPTSLDMFTHWGQSNLGEAEFSSGLDNDSCTVRVVGGGSWMKADADRYFDEQRKIIDNARSRFGALKVFFDVRDWVADSPHSPLQFQAMNAEIYLPTDRLVAVVRASVDKQHPRTALSMGNLEVFISTHAAELWLQAYSTR
jgi:hypothetical protein